MRARTYFTLAALAALTLTVPAQAQWADSPRQPFRAVESAPDMRQRLQQQQQLDLQQQQLDQLRRLNQTLEQQRQDQQLRDFRERRGRQRNED